MFCYSIFFCELLLHAIYWHLCFLGSPSLTHQCNTCVLFEPKVPSVVVWCGCRQITCPYQLLLSKPRFTYSKHVFQFVCFWLEFLLDIILIYNLILRSRLSIYYYFLFYLKDCRDASKYYRSHFTIWRRSSFLSQPNFDQSWCNHIIKWNPPHPTTTPQKLLRHFQEDT